MDLERVSEIIDSLGVIDVKYNGKSVWIERIIEATNEAEVKNLETGKDYTVDISKLKES
ncbi:small acid-soluble spore protein H (minor) [Clostridium cavendishii DSM 21758]|uniref:Small acid-soluble spore protein H (Minor) n=1 Tax=Clostridium cavendishii DSM 21758 TaxID=1121302 RepID=A0A1M6NIN0_9CLOT|nr:H-type small acid-soluble spore protein [Clostridium cavendishii]SHJ95537.1 small acid-soluble spore protein H (minor) [Clostridium cavendishii DSM 21758]